MALLNEVYEELKHHGLAESHNDFSRRWLNKSSRYMSMIKASGRDPSIQVLGHLAANLKARNDLCKRSRYGELRIETEWLTPLTHKVWTKFYQRALGDQSFQ